MHNPGQSSRTSMLSDLPQILGENLVLLVHRGPPSGGIECAQPTHERLEIPACCEQHVVSKGRLRKMALQLGDKIQKKREGPGERSRVFWGCSPNLLMSMDLKVRPKSFSGRLENCTKRQTGLVVDVDGLTSSA